jgi:hypothetical protein
MSSPLRFTLLDGTTVAVSSISLSNNRFYVGGEDITPKLRLNDMRTFSGFDEKKHLARLSDDRIIRQGGTPKPVDTRGTWELFGNQLLNEPLDAPLEALDSAVKKVVDSSGIKSIVVLAVAGLVAFAIITKAK